MDITPQASTQQPISDDQELAKALAGVMPDDPDAPAETPAAEPASTDAPAPVAPLAYEETPAPVTAPTVTAPTESTDLEGIKKDALGELRPLIDKVDLPAEEKFDTYLMLIRSTDDSSLIGPAHTAALAITDEKRKAEALLDVIKEIDYLSRENKDQPTT